MTSKNWGFLQEDMELESLPMPRELTAVAPAWGARVQGTGRRWTLCGGMGVAQRVYGMDVMLRVVMVQRSPSDYRLNECPTRANC